MASTSGADAVDLESIKVDLMKSITSSWEHVVKICEKNPIAHKIEISRSGNTVLHFAVESGREDIVEQLVELILKNSQDPVDDLSVKNRRGNTPLHLAASLGNIRMCKCIIGEHKQLLGNRNDEDETPLFLAARHGKKDAFLWLYEMCDSATTHDYCRSGGDNTVLHCAIEGGYFDLAFQIIHRQEDLMNAVTWRGMSPLHVLAGKPTAFRSGIYLHFLDKIIYHCIFVEELILETSQEKKNLKSLQHPEKDQTCINFFQELCKMIKLLGKSNKHLDAENPEGGQGHHSSNGAQGPQRMPSKYGRCLRFIWLIVSKIVLVFFSIIMPGSNKIRKLKEIKEKHVWSLQMMNKLLESASKNKYNGTPPIEDLLCQDEDVRSQLIASLILIATRNGIVEMVEKILQVFPMAIYVKDKQGKNIVMLAVENRQSHIYDFLLKSTHLDKDYAFQVRDGNKNNALHLAAKLQDYEGWFIPTSLLQMQWEAKWFEYVKNSLPPDVTVALNWGEVDRWDRKSPEDIYKREHEELLEKSKQWLNNTCNSCSFIAALIATVAFASAATVPGGVNQDTGNPIFQNRFAFRLFAMSSLVALCSSFISLLIFFALLTSKYQYKDFSKNLPRNLLFGLTSLFISMAAMLLCFGSGHFLMLDDHLKYAVIPVYALTCLAVTYFALQQFPSYVVLMKATFQNVPERKYYEDPL